MSLARSSITTAAGKRRATVANIALVGALFKRSCRCFKKRVPSIWIAGSSAKPRYLVNELLPEP